jgi:hypothetical protein
MGLQDGFYKLQQPRGADVPCERTYFGKWMTLCRQHATSF